MCEHKYIIVGSAASEMGSSDEGRFSRDDSRKSGGKNFTGNLPLVARIPRLKWRMSHKLPVISGEDLVKYLAKQGFEAKRQTSSHVIMQKQWRVFSVPLHRELKRGTLTGILKQAGIEVEDFKCGSR